MLESSVLREELEAVPVEWQMARRDHDRAVEIAAIKHRGLEHGRCRHEPAVKDLRAAHSLNHTRFQGFRCQAAVMADADSELSRLFPEPCGQKSYEGLGNELRRRRRQVQLFLVRRDRCAAHIIAVLQSHQDALYICHICPLSDSFPASLADTHLNLSIAHLLFVLQCLVAREQQRII